MPKHNKGSKRLQKKLKTQMKRFEVDRWGAPIKAPHYDDKYWKRKQTNWHRALFGPDKED